MNNAIEVLNLSKSYGDKLQALKNINFSIKKGEIFALLGPNGAGKSTLINIICGISKKNKGKISVFGFDNVSDYKKTRSLIGLVPQEIATDSFEKVINTLKFSRGLFNKPKSDEYLDNILKKLALYDKRNNQIRTLSGGMKRRVMIAKALSHEPKILFLDEPTAGVDVQLRNILWKNIIDLKKGGVTIFLTTHYIEEAQKIADKIGVIDKGEIIILEEKNKLMKKLGNKVLKIKLKKNNSKKKIHRIIKKYSAKKNNNELIFSYNFQKNRNFEYLIFNDLIKNSIFFEKIETEQSNLEEIFLKLVKK
ncbi:MAG: multidrug ABC transporter ATP-binding protein [Rickettsiales bacterium]|nr:multidrug ABC transporter ATP-binding protein [Rickettsiales bacterium]|tara:strand:- start:204 stop:1124 length:921 start_codon:yes stop_codon:yes gene_type:complete